MFERYRLLTECLNVIDWTQNVWTLSAVDRTTERYRLVAISLWTLWTEWLVVGVSSLSYDVRVDRHYQFVHHELKEIWI